MTFFKPKPRTPKPLYALEGRSWFGTKVILLYFRTHLNLTGAFLRRIVKGLGRDGDKEDWEMKKTTLKREQRRDIKSPAKPGTISRAKVRAAVKAINKRRHDQED